MPASQALHFQEMTHLTFLLEAIEAEVEAAEEVLPVRRVVEGGEVKSLSELEEEVAWVKRA